MVSRHGPCDTNRLREFLDWPPGEERASCELAEHLEQCEKCRKELEALAGGRWWNEVRPLVTPPAGPQTRTQPHEGVMADDPTLGFLAPPDEPGHLGRFGPYQVLGVHRGGMGVVLKALDPALSRTVAIKVLAPQLATSGAARQRFAREAKAAAAVVHHHVVAIYNVATDEASWLPYLVMPYIAGRSLQERIDRDGALEPAAVLRIGLQAAQGLAAAHAQGIVHRDVKPANILLENGVERVVLTDFGLARAADDASVTQSGVIAGTPQYMSPEQARGEAVGPRSDLFSLGSVLYAMCTGHPPFRAPNTMAVLRRVSDEKARPVREVNPAVPAPLAALIARLHAKNPSGRPATAAAVAAELERQLAALQTPPGRPTPPAPAAPAPRRLRGATVAAGLLAAAVGLGVAATRSRPDAVPILPDAPAADPVPGVAPGWAGPVLFLTDDGELAQPPAPPAPPTPGIPAVPKIPAIPGVPAIPAIPAIPAVPALHLELGDGKPFVVMIGGPGERVVGSGKPATKEYDLKDFTAVQVHGPFSVVLKQGKEFKVSVTADDNLFEYLDVSKDGGKLSVGLKGKKVSFHLSGKEPLRAAVTLPVLGELRLAGATSATAEGFASDRPLRLELSGACRLKGSVSAGDVEVNATGASSVQLSGGGKNPRLRASGGCNLRLGDFSASGEKLIVDATGASHVTLKGAAKLGVLHAEGASGLSLDGVALDAADVKLSGASSAKVRVKELLDYSVDGASSLRYLGDPKIGQHHKAGASSASKAK